MCRGLGLFDIHVVFHNTFSNYFYCCYGSNEPRKILATKLCSVTSVSDD